MLLVCLLSKYTGLSDDQEINSGFEDLVQFYTLPYIHASAKEEDFSRVVGLNNSFKKIVDNFLNSLQQVKSLVVAVSEHEVFNNSHFNAFT